MGRTGFLIVGFVMVGAQTTGMIVMWQELGDFEWGLVVGYVLPVVWFFMGRERLDQ